MILYRTRDIEGSARTMLSRYDTVLVRADCRIHNKIRLRPKLLQDLNPYQVRFEAGYRYLDEWAKSGGLLLYYIGQCYWHDVAAELRRGLGHVQRVEETA